MPRTPTMRPPATPTSLPQPVEHRTQTDRTQRSGAAVVRSSTRTGHSPRWGLRGPQPSSIASRVSVVLTLLAHLRHLVEAALDPLQRRLHLLLAVLGLVASLVDQVGRGDDEDQDLEELRLPVLEGPFAEVDGVPGVAEDGRGLALGRLIGHVLPPAEDDVEDEAAEEQQPDDDGQAVVAPHAAEEPD